jgi:drug/metabolite transporter (DMT)-like permease
LIHPVSQTWKESGLDYRIRSPAKSARPYLFLIFATAGWGVTTPISKHVIAHLGAFTTVGVQILAGAAALWVVALVKRKRRVGSLSSYAILGLLEPAVTYSALDLGLLHTSASDAALLNGLQPGFVLVLGVLFGAERLTRRSLASVGVASLGAMLVAGARLSLAAGIGDGLVLVSCLAASITVLLASRLAARVSAIELTAYQFGTGLVCYLPWLAFSWSAGWESFPPGYKIRYISMAAGVGILNCACYLLYNYSLGRVSVSTSGMSLNLIPLFGVLAAALLLGERPASSVLIGGLLIVGGMSLFPFSARAGKPIEERTTSVEPPLQIPIIEERASP